MLGPASQADKDDLEAETSTARDQITANFDHELQRLKGIEHSTWAAFNAVSQYVDWERPTRGVAGSRDGRRFESMLLGAGADIKRRAWTEALEFARMS